MKQTTTLAILSFLSIAAPVSAAHYQVYLLGGQSNANGRADADELTSPLSDPQTDVRFYWNRTQSTTNVGHLLENQWINLAPGSGHGTSVPVYAKEFGCEVSFGRTMADAKPTENIAIIKYSVGGSNLHTQWSASGSLYATFVSTVQAGLAALTTDGHTYELRGMLWQQGESDTGGSNADNYNANLTSLISRVRNDLFAGGALPFMIGSLSDSQYSNITTADSGPFKVRQAQEAVAAADAKVGVVITDGFNTRPSDSIHLDHTAQIALGQNFATQIIQMDGPDVTAPLLFSTNPSDDGGGVPLDADLVMTFNEAVQKGSAGSIVITQTGSAAFETIPVADARISVSGSTVTINPTGTFALSTGYSVQITDGAFEDLIGNSWTGINDTTTWNFSTELQGNLTGIFDENVDATNELDIEVTANTLATFKTDVLNAYNNSKGGVIDWETGFTTNTSNNGTPNNLLNSVEATYQLGTDNIVTINFNHSMDFYTNNINSQIEVLSQEGASQNALIAGGGNDAIGLQYTMTFSDATISELGIAMPSRSTYGTGVDFRATSDFSGGGSEILEFLIGGTPGTGDTFLHFVAPPNQTITSLSVGYLDDNGQNLANGQRRPTLDDLGFILGEDPLPGSTVGTTGIFDENTDATNEIDVELPANTLDNFKAAVLNAYNNNLGGVIDWETGTTTTTSNTSSSNNTITIANANYGINSTGILTVTFGRAMELYTNNVNFQINALSQIGSRKNALLPQGVATNAESYTMAFSRSNVVELGAAMPSRSTYGASGVDFQATANFSGGGSEVIDLLVGGTPGTSDVFFHFTAPGGESITSLAIAFVDDNGQGLASGQRRPILDDLGFITTSPTNNFVAWINDPAFGLAPSDRGFNDDPDGDGIANSLEALFGTNPSEYSAGLASVTSDGTVTTFTHPQSESAPSDLNGFYEWSLNLNDWYTGDGVDGPADGPTVLFAPNTVGSTTTVTATASESLGRVFIRAGVNQILPD